MFLLNWLLSQISKAGSGPGLKLAKPEALQK